MSDKSAKSENNNPEVRKGLYGVIADYTSVSKVMPETNSLTYRGYAVQDLVEHCSFEEVAYLLDKKVDSAEVKNLMKEVERQRQAREAADRPEREVPQPQEERPPEKKPEPQGKQSSLFEY